MGIAAGCSRVDGRLQNAGEQLRAKSLSLPSGIHRHHVHEPMALAASQARLDRVIFLLHREEAPDGPQSRARARMEGAHAGSS